MGVNNHQYKEQSHMSYLMKAGDVCVGYNLKKTQLSATKPICFDLN